MVYSRVPIHFGVSVPPHGEYADPRLLIALACEAEAAGWDGFFIWDHLQFMKGYSGPIIDPWIALSAIAINTERIRLGPMVTPLPRRRPWKLARETVTLDHLSKGRLILGVGIGYPADSEFEQFGEHGDLRIRAQKLDEGLDILVGLWSGEQFSYRGSQFVVQEAIFLPRPIQSPRIPIWVGGYWPNKAPFRRAARWDGVFPGRLTLERRRTWTPQMILVEDFRAIVAYVNEQRTTHTSYEYVIGGYTSGINKETDAQIVSAYAEAGATWWIENLHGYRGTFAEMHKRLCLGPPQIY